MEGSQLWGDAPHNAFPQEPEAGMTFLGNTFYPCLHAASQGRAALPCRTLDTHSLKRFRPCVAVFFWIKLQGAKAMYLSGGGTHEFHVLA